jgi:hypothetical protein
MILHHKLYIADTGEADQEETVNKSAEEMLGELAKCVADYFVKHFGFNIDQKFLFEGDGWMDPGPQLDLSVPHIDWDNTPLRRKPSELELDIRTGPTLQDIVSRNWIPPSLKGCDKDIAHSLRPRTIATRRGKA